MAKLSKILYIVTQDEFGGAQRYIFNLVNNLPINNFLISVASGMAKKNGLIENLAGNKNIATYRLNNLVREINPLKDILAYWEIKKLIKKINPDIVHLNSSKAGVIGSIAAKHAGVPKIIYTVHGFAFNEQIAGWKKLIYKVAEKFTAQYKNLLICVSEFERLSGVNLGIPEKKLTTIYNGIAPINFLTKNEARKKLNIPENKIVVGTVGNFYANKGFSYLVDAAKVVKEKFPEILFVIIGQGELKKTIEQKISSENLSPIFLLTGAVDQAAKYLKAFDVYVNSSLKEGFTYSIIEAMNAQLPIVATKVGGNPEAIKNNHNGLIVESKNSQVVAKAILNILENEKNLAEPLAHQAFIDYNNNFTLDKSVNKTIEAYNS